MEKYLKRRALFFSIMLILMSIPFNAFAESENIKEKLEKIIKKEEEKIGILKKFRKEKYILTNTEQKEKYFLLNLQKQKKKSKHKISILYGFSNKKTALIGEEVEIYAHQIQDKEFASWNSPEDISIKNPENKLTSFIMIDKDVKIIATFVDIDSGTIDEEVVESEEIEENQNNDMNEINRENKPKNLKKKRKNLKSN